MSDDRPVEGARARRARERVGDAYVDRRGETGARGYRWRSFDSVEAGEEPGDYAASVSTKHGAMSRRNVDPIATELIEGLVERRPDLVKFPEAVAAWSRAEARCLLLERWFAEHGLLDADGKPTASESLLGQSERLAMQLRERLGLDPKSEAWLALSQADAARSVVDLDALRARGREALAAGRVRVDAGQVRGRDGTAGSDW